MASVIGSGRRNRIISVIQEEHMSRKFENVDISAILEAIEEAKEALQDVIFDVENDDELEETVEDELSFSGFDVPYDELEEEFQQMEEANTAAVRVFNTYVYEPLMNELKEALTTFVENSVWYHEERLGNWMSKISKYSILQELVKHAKSNDIQFSDRCDHYDVFNERVEDILNELRKTIMLESDGLIVLDHSFKICNIAVEAEESLQALDSLYKGEGWIREFLIEQRKENEYSEQEIENMVECDTEYLEDDTEQDIYKISEESLESEYETIQQNLEFLSIGSFDPLQDMVDDLIRVQPAKEYVQKLEALLTERFALVNERIQELRMDVSW